MKAITPTEAKDKKQNLWPIPDYVIEAANDLIVANMDQSGNSSFTLKSLTSAVRKRNKNANIRKLFDESMFDIEPHFRKAGWTVVYDQPPGMGDENYEPTFKFKKKKTK